MTGHNRRWGAACRAGAGAAVVLVVAGCARPDVTVPVAPHAADPLCAEVVLATPEELAGMRRLVTSSQATRAWGDPAAPVVLRCGVEVPGPSTEFCQHVDDLAGHAVDWLVVEDDAGWTFTTYGRDPATEVRVPAAVAEQRSTSFVLDLGPAVSRVEAGRTCVGLDDVPG